MIQLSKQMENYQAALFVRLVYCGFSELNQFRMTSNEHRRQHRVSNQSISPGAEKENVAPVSTSYVSEDRNVVNHLQD